MKNGMFKGWKDVFKFTFVQNTKTKTFKTALIGIAALFFIIFFAINLIMGYMQNDGKKKKSEKINEAESIYVINNVGIDNKLFEEFKDTDDYISKSEVIVYSDKTLKDITDADKKKSIFIEVYKSDNDEADKIQYMLDVYATGDLSKKNVENVAGSFSKYFDEIKYSLTSLKPEIMQIVSSDINVHSEDINDADETLGVMLAKIFVPMIFTLLIYFMILMYGQSISKVLIVEKNSKLMEVLLISVKPYAVVLGKILAMYLTAIMQMGIWIMAGIAGFKTGDIIADRMFDNYDNSIVNVISMIKTESASAFTTGAIVLGIAAMLMGFLLYCVFAGFVSSNITKAEELANGMSVFQMVTVIGFMGAYLLPLIQQESPVTDVLRYIPVTSAFMLPSDVIVGNIGIIGTLVSIMIIIVTTIVLIIFTGKNYKKKVF